MIQSKSRNGEAGAIMLCNTFSSMTASDWLVNSNFADTIGGGIYVMREDSKAVYALQFSFCFFANNTAQIGNDIAFTENYYNLMNSSCFQFCFSLSEQNRVWMCTQGLRKCTSGEERNNLTPNPSGTVIHVDPMRESGDVAGCGDLSNECGTLGYSCDHWVNSFHTSIKLYSGEYSEASIPLTFQNIIIEKNTSSSSITIRTIPSSSAFCTLLGGSLTMRGMQIVHSSTSSPDKCLFAENSEDSVLALHECTLKADSTSAAFNKPFFVLTKGRATLESCEISSVLFESTSLFATEQQAHLVLSNAKISMISRRTGDGSVFSKAVQAEESFVLSNVSMKNCKCLDGNGGALYLELDALSNAQIGADSDCMFDTCTVPTDSQKKRKGGGIYIQVMEGADDFKLKMLQFIVCNGWKGKKVFIESKNLSKVINAATLAFNPSVAVDSTDLDELSGMENVDQNMVIPLVVFLRNFTSPAYVSGQSTDSNYRFCGYSDYPCQSVEGASAARFASTKRNIRFLPSFSFRTETLLNSQSYSFDAEEDSMPINVGSSQAKVSEGLLINSVETSFSRIKFVLEASLNGRSAFILSNANVLSVTDCAAVPAASGASVSYCLVKITSGKLSITHFAAPLAQKLSFGNAPFVAISGSASADFDALDANGMTTSCSNGLISVDSGNITTINNSTFRSSNLTSSAFIVSSSGTYSITIKNTTFEEIKRTAGDGSCVFLNTRSGFASSFTASNCTFTKCTATENGKGGGAIALHISSQSALTLESSAFTSCQAPKPSAGSKGKGGAVLIDFSEVNTRYLLANTLSFASNTAEHGNDLFVSSADLTSSITTAAFQFFHQDAPFAPESCAGTDSKWPSVAIPLVFYLLPRESDVHVLSEGNDVSACGFADYGCQTITFALTQRTDESGELIVHPVYALSEAITLSGTNEITFKGTVAETKMRMIGAQTGASEAMIRIEQASAWKHLAFCLQPTIPSPQSSVYLVCSANAMLNLEDCSILSEQGEEKCAFGFLAVVEGSFAMTRFTVNSIGLQSAEMVKVCSKGSGAIDSCTWTNVTSAVETGIIAYSSAGTLSMHNTTISQSASSCCSFVEGKHGKSLVVENNTFSGITRNEGNGSVIKADIGENESLELNDVSVDSCSSVRGCGGGVYISTSSTAKIRIGKEGTATRFARCSAKGTLPKCGFGGGVFLKCADWLADLVLTAVSFGTEGDGTSNEAEGGGSNAFVEGYSLDKIVTNQSFKFDIDKESTAEFGKLCGFEDGNVSYAIPLVVFLLTFEPPATVGGNTGFDYRMCGVSIYPCATIPFTIYKRFPASNSSGASIRLTADFSFKDAISFDTQPTEVNAEQIGGVTDVRSDGIGEGAGLLCSSVNVKFSEIVFGLPGSFDELSRTTLFLCSSATLTIHRCEFQNSSSSAVEYRIIHITSGKVELNGCKIKDFAMGNAEIIVLNGNNAECSIEGMEASKLSREEEGAMILITSGKKLTIENSNIENSTMANNNHITINSLANGLLKNVTFSNLSRTNGDGGVIVGEMGTGEVLGEENCSFKLCGCYSARTIGGCVLMDVEEGGIFRFERNKVEFCIVSSGDGYGGGLFLTFGSSHLDYSMRNNTFENNGALRGKDAYVVCEEPGAAILLMYWNGSASEDTASDRLWVRRLSEPADGGVTMIDYLFPPSTSFVFVDGGASAAMNCGLEMNPCTSVELGFYKMNSSQSIIQLVGNSPIDAVVNRRGISLTIQSYTTTKAMIFGRNGKFELVEGTRSTTLTFSKLCFVLPSSPNPSPEMSSLVEVSIGQCSFFDCSFEQGSSRNSNPSKWIVSGGGGVVHFSSCALGEIPFLSGGIASIEGASLSLESCSFSFVSSDAPNGLIVGRDNCDITLKNTEFVNCETRNGHVLEIICPKSVHVSGACTFDGCSSIKGDGGILNCILEAEGSLIVNKTSIVSCEVNAVNGKGGGIYLDLKENVNAYLFSDLTFSGNDAFEGKDMFVRSADLNASIIPSLFDFEYFGADGETKVDLKGRDKTHFVSVSADLLYFLVKYSSSMISVGSAGIDFIGCGKAETPCHSLWRGINNLQAIEDSQPCFVEILDEAAICECYEFGLSQLSIGLSSAAASNEFARLSISQTSDGSSKSIFSSNNSLSFSSVQFHLPAFFSNERSSVVSSSDGYLIFNSTSFHSDATSVLEYVLLSNKGGTAELLNVSVSSLVFARCPFALSSYVTLEECCFHNICSPTSTEGGAMSVCLERSDLLRVKSCQAELCKCSIKNGKGGFLYVDCSKSTATTPLRFEGEMTFERNDAQLGKNIFIASTELNASVTLATFAFSFESMKEDSNAFVGIEGESEELDLFRYLVSYTSSSIFLSADGEDVMRCGSSADPCCSFWKGMQQISNEASPKLISITKSTEVADTFTLSNFTIQSSSLEEEEKQESMLLFREKAGEVSEPFLRCTAELSLKYISLIIASSFDNSASEVILSESGMVSLGQCSLGAEVMLGGMQISRCSFIVCVRGQLLLAEVSMELTSLGKSAIFIGSVACMANNFTCTFVNISDGSIFEVMEVAGSAKGVNANEKSGLRLNSSAILSVSRTDNGASVINSKRERNFWIEIDGTSVSDCIAGQSQKGGAVFVILPEEGSFSVLKSTIIRCCCSDEGRGGVFYIEAMRSGVLDFVFQSVSFAGNSAKVGNDIYVSCNSISEQINEAQFRFDMRESIYVRLNAIYGIDTTDHIVDTNLMDFITIFQADTIVVSSVSGKGGKNERRCGTYVQPCLSLGYAVSHVTSDFDSRLIVDGGTFIEEELTLDRLLLASRSKSQSNVTINSIASSANEAVIATLEVVSIANLWFIFEQDFVCSHLSFISPRCGVVELANCSFSSESSLPLFSLLDFSEGNGTINSCLFSSLTLLYSVIQVSSSCSVSVTYSEFSSMCSSDGAIVCENSKEINVSHSKFANNSLASSFASSTANPFKFLSATSVEELTLTNCSFCGLPQTLKRGILVKISSSSKVLFDFCIFEGNKNSEVLDNSVCNTNELCSWNGSLADVQNSTSTMKDTTIANSSIGGMSVFGGSMMIEDGKFINNNPKIENYQSIRRNIVCAGSGLLKVASVKGEDGVKEGSSLWILNEGCTLKGIAEERESAFFIPQLERVESEENGGETTLKFLGSLLVPCNLSFRVVKRVGSEALVERYSFEEGRFVSEAEVLGAVPSKTIYEAGEETEVSVCILFGDPAALSSTVAFVLKNRSDPHSNEEGNIVEGDNEIEFSWPIIGMIVFAAFFLISMIAFIVVVVLLQKKLKEAKNKVIKERLENEQIMRNAERRRENEGRSFEMSEMPSTLLEGMSSQIPLLIDNDEEDLPEPPSMTDGILNENDLPDLESPVPFSENASASGVSQSHSLNVISAKKPFREKEKKNIKTLHSAIHSVQGNFTLGTRAMDVVDGKEVILAIAGLFEHLITVGDERVEMMGKQLCTYSIFVEEETNEIFILTEELKDEKEIEEIKRWKAPEVGNEDEEVEDEGIEQAVVFKLGLILHEMITGEVPLSECNSEEAQEMMRDGVRPLTEGIEEEEMVILMEKMWADDPNERCSLKEVVASLRENG
ncbi:uncharacterized protein MONOS_121 [Monocercomonoides exilis]|uniref:uncharacterized protein n=1 Tax=Monocercomonoides exilis TaxID=2049356 RepID=UPI00355AC279|nr:hypothetical protein MONOS_121 [Monocercomonoides exilis]|eukprot:MONOS_121.1-p1 / transcript=MONOS_121.1 / gene=MONOS_121 / organism=Monocercomonoides_exilis_PA203 / gene_product=unspecified product / transcript_product=unspecified product / location=Mono_scaffold00002:207792-218522(+) / protein_length=3576 / sequence_SO=supercontig / SO=protein_coding / is_pseudo=false